jgi:endonuclease YncB( thermonuclease family)
VTAARRRKRRIDRQTVLVFCGVVVAALLIGRFTVGPTPKGGVIPTEELIGPCGVTRVVDGDTLDVSCSTFSTRVRLLRINTPERERRGYREARNALRGLVRGQNVYLAFERPGAPERGDHGRLLAYVHVGERNVNVEMVRLGWSRFWTRYGEGRFAGQFRQAEREARDKGHGLWARR